MAGIVLYLAAAIFPNTVMAGKYCDETERRDDYADRGRSRGRRRGRLRK